MGLSRLGVTAKFRPRNDIEIEGRKISGTGGFFDGNTLIYQGTILVDPKPDIMFQALNVARDKYAKHGLKDASQRVTSSGRRAWAQAIARRDHRCDEFSIW